MARYQLVDHVDKIIFDEDTLDLIADHMGVKPLYLYTRLSANKGSFTRGRGGSQLTVTDHGRGEQATGPAPTQWKYVATYEEEQTGAHWNPQHELTLDEIYLVAKHLFYQKLATSTIDHKLASKDGLKGMVKVPLNYHYGPVQINRFHPKQFHEVVDAWPADKHQAFDDAGQAFRDRLKKVLPN